MSRSILANDVHVQGNLSATTMAIPAGTIVDDDVNAAAEIAATKMEHEHVRGMKQRGTIAAETEVVHIVNATGTLQVFKASLEAACTSSDTVSVDLHKSTGGGSYATVLSAPIGFSSSDAARSVKTGTISSAGVIAGDQLKVVVTITSNSSGADLLAQVTLTESSTST